MAAPAPVRWGGLVNQGSTCYLNSVIQVLYHIPLFRKKVFELQCKDKLVKAMQGVFCRLSSGEQNISTTDLTSAFGWGVGEIAVQHDVHELLQILLDRLEKQEKGPSSEHFIQYMFCGELMYRSQAVDTDVQYVADRLERFYDLEAVVEGCKDLKESLEKLSKPEKIEGVSVELPSGLGTAKVNIERSFRLVNLPPVLMIHPNRVTFDTESYELRTINSKWVFPLKCDLEQYVVDKESLKLDPESRSKLNECPLSVRVSNHKYTLHAILIHAGTTKMGHYYAYIFLDGQWICFNDEQVMVVSEEAVWKSAFGGVGFKNNFYETERASLLIYINQSCMEEILNESDVVVPDHILAQKQFPIPFRLCGYEGNGVADVDFEFLYTPLLPFDFTLEDLKVAIASVIPKEVSFQIYVVDKAMEQVFFLLEDVEKFKAEYMSTCHLLLVPNGLTLFLRTRWEHRFVISKEFLAQYIKRSSSQIFVREKGGEERVAKESDVQKYREFLFVDVSDNGRNQKRAPPSKEVRVRNLVYVPVDCNGMWEYKPDLISLEKFVSLHALQERVQSIFHSEISPDRVFFIEGAETRISFPPLLRLTDSEKNYDSVRTLLLDKNSRSVHYTVLRGSYTAYNLDVTLVFNLGWARQPRIFLKKSALTISLCSAAETALEQIHSSLPEHFVNSVLHLDGLEREEQLRASVRLFKTASSSKIDEVVEREEANDHHLYVMELRNDRLPGYSSVLVFYRALQPTKSFFGLPTFLLISDAQEETGKVILERLWKRLRVPEEKVKAEGARWLLSVETSGNRLQRVGLKDTLKSVIPEEEKVVRFIVDRPQMKELDGTFPEKDTEALVINS